MSLPARSYAWCLAVSLLIAWPLQAAGPVAKRPATTAVDMKLVGHYYLSGAMETGSELLLRPDGRFEWNFAYGALELAAEGRWHRDGGRVVLRADKFQGPDDFPRDMVDNMPLRIDGDGLIPGWPWDHGVERGRYSRE